MLYGMMVKCENKNTDKTLICSIGIVR